MHVIAIIVLSLLGASVMVSIFRAVNEGSIEDVSLDKALSEMACVTFIIAACIHYL